MLINPDTMKALRNERKLSQEALAQKSKTAKRTIARLESNDPPKTVRKHTVESLAAVLGVKPETLGRPINEISDDDWKERGYTLLKVLLSDDVRLNYRWVMHHYKLEFGDLVDAAPWIFTLLAEMSLKERRRRLEEYDAAFEEAMRLLPDHLGHGVAAYSHFNQAVSDENDSLAKRDIFGKVVLDTQLPSIDPFDPEETNPFYAFVKELAERTGTGAIKAELIELPYGSRMPRWPLFQEWLDELTGGDYWAKFAVGNVKIGLSDMPEELKHPDKTTERIGWLVGKIPSEVREREEQRRAEAAAALRELMR